jgi:nucleoside-diphosphate-sugar epimerase
MSTFVLFGGSGFIGTHLRLHLAAREPDASIYVADTRPCQGAGSYHACDVRQPIDIDLNLGDDPLVINLAAVHTTPGHPDEEYFRANVLGAENVCDFARRVGARRMVFTSSIAPYGPGEDRKTEETLPMPVSPYGISKLVAEKIHMIWQAEDPRRQLSIVRPGVVFGKGEGGNFTRLYRALSRGVFAYPGRRDTLKAGIYVKDLVRVIVAMAESPRARLQLYNACFENPPRIDTIVECMMSTIGIRRRILTVPPFALRSAARLVAWPGFGALGVHPDRVRKLMLSTNVDGSKLARDYPLHFGLQDALDDWWMDCGGDRLC